MVPIEMRNQIYGKPCSIRFLAQLSRSNEVIQAAVSFENSERTILWALAHQVLTKIKNEQIKLSTWQELEICFVKRDPMLIFVWLDTTGDINQNLYLLGEKKESLYCCCWVVQQVTPGHGIKACIGKSERLAFIYVINVGSFPGSFNSLVNIYTFSLGEIHHGFGAGKFVNWTVKKSWLKCQLLLRPTFGFVGFTLLTTFRGLFISWSYFMQKWQFDLLILDRLRRWSQLLHLPQYHPCPHTLLS